MKDGFRLPATGFRRRQPDSSRVTLEPLESSKPAGSRKPETGGLFKIQLLWIFVARSLGRDDN
jgi:hypothetical protein